MSKMTKILLVLSLSFLTAGLAFVTGMVNVGGAVWLYVTFPAGAILFGLFLIFLSLQGATASYNEEQRRTVAALAKDQPVSNSGRNERNPEQKNAYALVHQDCTESQ